MGLLFIFSIESAIGVILFYLFYKLLMNKETFHRFNRVFLIFVTLLTWILPISFFFFRKFGFKISEVGVDMNFKLDSMIDGTELDFFSETIETASVNNSKIFSFIVLIYFLGLCFFLIKNLYSFLLLKKLLVSCKRKITDSGKILFVHNRTMPPFSWMRYIVMSEQDFSEHREEVLMHEEAHVDLKHYFDLILVNLSVWFQWYNPAMWLLRNELQAIHEFEADERVLSKGVNAKDYQLLLIKKAVGSHFFTMANSLTHSNLKKRITMMMKKRSNPWARLKYVVILPLIAVTISAFAFPETKKITDFVSKIKITDLFSETKITSEEECEESKKPESVIGIEEKTVVQKDSTAFTVVEKMPEFPGGLKAMMEFLSENTRYPAEAVKNKLEGRVIVGFVVGKDGLISDAKVIRGVAPSLDAEALRVINLMPKWKPGEQRGEVVAVNYNVPVLFKLSADKNKSDSSGGSGQ